MRILYISARQCYPPNSGGKLRDYWLLTALSRASELTYLCYTEPGSATASAADLPFCERIIGVPRPPRYSPLKILRGMLGSWPLPVLNYTSPAMIDAIRRQLRENRYDLVHLDSFHLAGCMAAVEPETRRVRVVYGWHDIASELISRYREISTSLARRIYARFTARGLEQVESSILASAYGHIVCSERERQLLLARAPQARIAVIENGVDTATLTPDGAAPDPTRIVFVGAMHYYANVDAVTWFVRRIWPSLHQRFARYRFTIVGTNPTPEVLALRAVAGVEVTGTVPDVRPYYREAFAAVVPLRVGTGTRLKILEAMAAGVPVLSTPLGAEGLEVTPGQNILIADAEADWLPAFGSLLASSGRREELVRAGRRLVCAQYDWTEIGAKLAMLYQNWLERER